MSRSLDTIKPLGIRKAWDRCPVGNDSAASLLSKFYVPEDWGKPQEAVGWFDDDDQLRVLIADYPNARRATLRRRSRDFKVTFGKAA